MTREEAIEWLKSHTIIDNTKDGQAHAMAIEALENVRVKGEWIERRFVSDKETRHLGFWCSACNCMANEPHNYCPNCGARMVGE